MHAVLAPDTENALADVTAEPRMFQDIGAIAALASEDVFDPLPRQALSFAFFASSQSY